MARVKQGGMRDAESEDAVDPANKGPKRFLRCHISWMLLPRKMLLAACLALCVLAGGRRLYGFSKNTEESAGDGGVVAANESPNTLRGVGTKWSRKSGVLLPPDATPYCSAPLDYPVAHAPQRVGASEDGDSLVLRQLQVTIRHGDRSAIHNLPGAPEERWKCQPYTGHIESIWQRIDRFSIQNVDGRPLERQLRPELMTATDMRGERFEEGICRLGQLTEVGVQQHLTLGENMRQAYSSLLSDIQPGEIYVRSTDYTRTLQSAAAFLMSFFPGSGSMTLITDENEGGEVMHGIGLKTGGKDDSTGGPERVTLGGCKHASELSKTQNGGFGPRADVVSDLAGIFSEGISKLKMTETADNLHAMSCHSKRLPCTPKGCVTEALALSVFSEADRQMCLRYQGAAGGLEAAALALYPFTNEILTRMREVPSVGSDETTTKTPIKFALYSGHDTVIAPLLAALGAYDCKWPPYASHIALELWSKPTTDGGTSNKKHNGDERRLFKKSRQRALLGEQGGAINVHGEDARGLEAADFVAEGQEEAGQEVADRGAVSSRGGAAGLEGEAKEGHESKEQSDRAFVRVTFNGKPVTHRITDCRDLSETEGPYGREFCPLSAFAKTIGRAIAPHKSLDEACSAFEKENRR